MNESTRDIQRRLLELGYAPGPIDGILGARSIAAVKSFQRANGLSVDGIAGPITRAALFPVPSPAPVTGIVPAAWMPNAGIKGIVVHWTAGGHKASANDREHYHVLIEADGGLIRGVPSIAANSMPKVRAGYAAHTLNCNTGFIGVSLCGMAGAVERPFRAGPAPLTRAQWETLPKVLAAFCRRYCIAVATQTVLSHAEVQATLGITQRGKWDIAILPFDPSFNTAKKVGDAFRAATKALL